MVPTEEPSESGRTSTAVPTAGTKSARTRRLWRVYLSVGFVALLVAATMGYSLRTGAHMVKVYAPLMDAAIEIRLKATQGHLWLEEIFSGDSRADISTVWEHLERSAWYATAMLEGGQSSDGTIVIVPLDDPGLRREIEAILQEITHFRALAEEKLAARGDPDVSAHLDQRFDDQFAAFLTQAAQVEKRLHLLMMRELQRFQTVQTILIAACIGLAALVAMMLGRYDRERTQAFLDLGESEENLHITLNSIGDAVIGTDPRGHITRMNPVAESLIGWTLEETRGKPLTEVFTIVNAQTREPAVDPVKRVLENGRIVGLANHTLLIAKDGTEYQIADSAAPIVGGNGKIKGVVLVFRDVTEEYRLQQELRETFRDLKASEEKFRLISEQSLMAIMILQDGVVQYANTAYCTMSEYSLEEVLGWGPHDRAQTIHPNDRAFVMEQAAKKQAREKDVVAHYSYRGIRKSGRTGWVDQYSRTILYEGKPADLVTLIDITERKQAEVDRVRLEAQVRQQQKLEAIGTLASGVAHEINNPITGIMNYAQLIHDRLDPESPLREFAGEIGRETERVAKIVRNLLSFARQEKESHSPARLADIVDNTVSLIRTVIRRDQISLEVDVPDDLPKIKCRSQQIQQVLMNLLTNARDALNERYSEHDPDKIMSVTARPFEKEGRPWVRVTVEDHGAGIPNEIRDRLFDPFFTSKNRTQGTGLGLSISHGIVQDHHGELSFECEAGRYTRFHLDLPVDNGWALE